MKTYAVRIVVITLALAGCLAPVTWAAEQDSNPSLAADLGLGLASFACSVPYGAVKVSTAILGGHRLKVSCCRIPTFTAMATAARS